MKRVLFSFWFFHHHSHCDYKWEMLTLNLIMKGLSISALWNVSVSIEVFRVCCCDRWNRVTFFLKYIFFPALKKFKKPASKRKPNGKKVSKGQAASKAKQKSEMETPVKEQLSELEKEILIIQINELEGKLNRWALLLKYYSLRLNWMRFFKKNF